MQTESSYGIVIALSYHIIYSSLLTTYANKMAICWSNKFSCC